MLADKIPVALIGAGGGVLGMHLTAAYLGVSLKQKAKDIPVKEERLLYAGAIAGIIGGVYVGRMVV